MAALLRRVLLLLFRSWPDPEFAGRPVYPAPTGRSLALPVGATHQNGASVTKGNDVSHLGLLGQLEGIVDVDSEVTQSALDAVVTEQQLDGPQILGAPIN